MGVRLRDFAGRWVLERAIRDARAQRDGTFSGTASFEPRGAVLFYHEAGELRMGGAAMAAEQSHVWRQEGAWIRVEFHDGRPFHRFEAASTAPGAHHHCAPDLYAVSYDFGNWPEWRSRWRVSGPRKDYVMTSIYRPEK